MTPPLAPTGAAGGVQAGSRPHDRARLQEFIMTDKPKKLFNSTRGLLTAAARKDHMILPPQLSAAAARQVVRSLLNAALVEEIPAPLEDADYVWRKADDGSDLMLRATDLGLACIRDAQGCVSAPHLSR